MVAIAEADGGAVAERYTYTAYGKCEVRVPDFSLDANSESDYWWTSLYTAREFDAETGLYYYRARYYDVDMGRFIGRDPKEYGAGDFNLYRYCTNNPTNATDATGLETYVLIIAVWAPTRPVSTPAQQEIRRILNTCFATLTRDKVIVLFEQPKARAVFDAIQPGPYSDDYCALRGWKVKGRENFDLSGPTGQGGDGAFAGSWNPNRLLDNAEDTKKGMDIVYGAVLVHETVAHGIAGAHLLEKDSIDAKTPKAGSDLSTEASNAIKSKLGIK